MMRVILLNGAIASGKSTVGRFVAGQLRLQQTKAVFYDLDDEVRRLNSGLEWEEGEGRLNDWLFARKATALKTVEILKEDGDVVVAGPFFLREEIAAYTDYISLASDIFLYTLTASLDERLHWDATRQHANPLYALQAQQEAIDHLPYHYGCAVANTLSIEETAHTILHMVSIGVGKIDMYDLNIQ